MYSSCVTNTGKKRLAVELEEENEKSVKLLKEGNVTDDLCGIYLKHVLAFPKFTVSGEIKDPTGIFFLPPEESNQSLIKAIHRGEYIMLQGHRGSGKTTRCLYAIQQQLLEYSCIWITMQAAISVRSVDKFWATFGKHFMSAVKAQKGFIQSSCRQQ